MNWDIVASTGEWAGAIAVVATLFYLARQIKQTNDISRSNISNELLARYDQVNAVLLSDKELRSVLLKEDVSDDEMEQIFVYTTMVANIWVSIQIAFDQGQIDEQLFDSLKRDVSFTITRSPLTRTALLEWLSQYPEAKQYSIFEPVVGDTE